LRKSGEFARIDLFLKAFTEAGGLISGAGVRLGPGDDAAVLTTDSPLAVTTDSLVENVHFRRSWSTWAQVGHKALAVNLSDLAAMAAKPVAFTCALTLPADLDDDAVSQIARGMGELARRFDARLVGGNFSRGTETSLTITAFGAVGAELLRRDAARPGDAVLLLGEVGTAAAELRWLESARSLPAGRSALLEPAPLVEEALKAVRLARCGIDVSDGLVQDLRHIADASQVGVRLDYAAVPTSPPFLRLIGDLDARGRARLLLAGGEDYALVVTAPKPAADELRRAVGATLIGEVVAGSGVTVEGLPPGIDLAGHDHFAAR
jgi:thiamine-monophosphate kinase